MARRGAAATARALLDVAIERALGVETRGHVQLEALGVDAPGRAWYAQSDWLRTWRSLRALGVTSDDVMLDYGAGKGRVIVLAMRLPFRRVVGLEISRDLADRARANVARRAHSQRCEEVEIVEGDAAAWSVPDDVTVVYMYSPFTGPLFAHAIEQILASLARRPRRLRLVYDNPFEHDFLLSTRRFRPVAVLPFSWPRGASGGLTMDTVTYEAMTERLEDSRGDPATVGSWAGPRETDPLMPARFRQAKTAVERDSSDGVISEAVDPDRRA